MSNPRTPGAPLWTVSPSAKDKNAVQRAVTALLDELAPERVLKRGEKIRVPVEQHRTPSGCVLQGADAAVSVSWFVSTRSEAGLGELHIIVWRGTVSRGGSSPNREGATIVKELVLQPIDRPTDDCVWRATNGTEYDSAGLAAHCTALLAEQMRAAR
ncbi:MAG: hypothetical protein ABI681_03620 [Gemmatimonadales bacterium]